MKKVTIYFDNGGSDDYCLDDDKWAILHETFAEGGTAILDRPGESALIDMSKVCAVKAVDSE